ncbi:DNA/RNA helicase [Paenibacillus polymyxa]|uniref:DNA/RNA helicase n=1 Tax=Paenibacillus TaxID=44249 RepID=UPI0004252468|nr:DNA/RNA helicase [Paenibacillus polymyxa]AOK91356.1 DNA/RNA helicase [Paenibacillus polymyxa]KYG92863.1 DNA/RNA helicase [Paenibacillus polymyxa]
MRIDDYKPKQNVTEKINGEEAEWKYGDIVLISSGTASGKSFFIRNKLEELADQQNVNILLLVNRRNLYDQNKEAIEDTSRIKVELYQTIENRLDNDEEYDFSPYTYIVCDESHYFTTDSGFNDNSDDSLQAILGLQSQIRIFMSATGHVLFSYIKNQYRRKLKQKGNKIWTYSIPIKFNQIASLSFYTDFYAVEKLIEHKFNKADDKIIYFADTIQKAFELYQKYDDSLFVCSKSSSKNRKYLKHVDDDQVESMVKQNRFDCKYLFTTTVLDNGFDLKDEQIKLIVCDIFDVDTMLQCIGRKRFKNDQDKVHVVLLNRNNRNLNNYLNSVQMKLDEADAFIHGGVEEWKKLVGKFSRKSNHIIKDNAISDGKYKSKKTVSRVKYLQAVATRDRLKAMLDQNRETNNFREESGGKKESDAYMMYISNLLHKNKITLIEKRFEQEELCSYLDTIVGKRIYKEGQKQVIEKFDIKDYRGRLQKDISQLQSYLQSNQLKYAIGSFPDNRKKLEDGSNNPHKGKRYWLVSKFNE